MTEEEFRKQDRTITMILGFEVDAWCDMYRLWKHEKAVEPLDLWELLKFWQMQCPRTPMEAFKIGARFAEAQPINDTVCREMLRKFLMTANR